MSFRSPYEDLYEFNEAKNKNEIKNNSTFKPYKSETISEILDYSIICSEIAIALIKYRKSLNLTQKQLAKKLNMRQSMISKLESGQYNPTFKMLLKISYKLNHNSDLFLIIIKNINDKLKQELEEEDE